MQPGDLIEWFYESSRKVVAEHEELWSTLIDDWVLIGSGLIHILISIDEKQLTWMNEEGLFHAYVDDVQANPLWGKGNVGCSTKEIVKWSQVI